MLKFNRKSWRRKAFRKKDKGRKSSKTKLDDLENINWQENPAYESSGTTEEDPRSDWRKWNYKDNANSGSRRGNLPKNWDSWDDNVTTSRPLIGDMPEHWKKYIYKQD